MLPTSRAASSAATWPPGTELQRLFLERVRADVARRREDPDVSSAADDIVRLLRPARTASELAQPRAALARVERAAKLSAAVPLESRLPLGRIAKAGLARLMQFYIGHVVHQVASFAAAVAGFARAMLGAVDHLAARIEALEALEARDKRDLTTADERDAVSG